METTIFYKRDWGFKSRIKEFLRFFPELLMTILSVILGILGILKVIVVVAMLMIATFAMINKYRHWWRW